MFWGVDISLQCRLLLLCELDKSINKEPTMNTEQAILVEIKNVYGIEKIYPVCERAELFARMTGCKTLTEATIHYIKKLGYAVNVQTGRTSL